MSLEGKRSLGQQPSNPQHVQEQCGSCSLFLGRWASCPEPLQPLVLQLQGFLQSRARPGSRAGAVQAFDPNAALPCQKGPFGAAGWCRVCEPCCGCAPAAAGERKGCWKTPFLLQPPQPDLWAFCSTAVHSPRDAPACIALSAFFSLLECSPLTQQPAQSQQGSSTGTAFPNHCFEAVSHLNLHAQVQAKGELPTTLICAFPEPSFLFYDGPVQPSSRINENRWLSEA